MSASRSRSLHIPLHFFSLFFSPPLLFPLRSRASSLKSRAVSLCDNPAENRPPPPNKSGAGISSGGGWRDHGEPVSASVPRRVQGTRWLCPSTLALSLPPSLHPSLSLPSSLSPSLSVCLSLSLSLCLSVCRSLFLSLRVYVGQVRHIAIAHIAIFEWCGGSRVAHFPVRLEEVECPVRGGEGGFIDCL